MLDSLFRWPSILLVAHYPDMRIMVTKAEPLDSFQAVDMISLLIDLDGKSCTNEDGERVRIQSSQASHTLTKIVVNCEPDVGLQLQDQTARFDAVLEVIAQGQTAYGSAAVTCEVWLWPPAQSASRRSIGDISSTTATLQPLPVSNWTQDSIILPVTHWPGWRIIVITDHILGPTLDRWDTKWFILLCAETGMDMAESWQQQRPLESFWWPLSDHWLQHITIRFKPSNMQGCAPVTVGGMIGVMKTLISLFERQGARPLRFNIVNSQGCHVGVGWIEFGTVPQQLELINSTIANPTR